MARNGRGQILASPEITVPVGHIVNQGETFDTIQQRREQGLDTSDLAPLTAAQLGYVAVEEPEVVRHLTD
ncbi:MAG TPA: hypothetical protein VF401_04805 [Candidatus Saccharimonadales bacterium]